MNNILDERMGLLEKYFDKFEKDGNAWMRRKMDSAEFPLYFFAFYKTDVIENIGKGQTNPKFLVD